MKKQLKPLLLSMCVGICIMLFVLLAVLTTIYKVLPLDVAVANFCKAASPTGFIAFLKIFTYIGSVYCLASITLSILFIKNKTLGIVACLMMLFASLFSVAVKYIIKRSRPENMLVEEIGYSFPSAHALLTFVVLGFVIYCVIKCIKNKTLKITISVVLSAVIALVGMSRVVLGVHHFTDVLAGWIIAIPILIASICMCNYFLKHPIGTKNRLM